MYINQSRKQELIEQGLMRPDETCLFQCGREPKILWHQGTAIYLCPEDAQYLATQLLKDVGRCEVAEGISVKVRTELAQRPGKSETVVSIDDIASDGKN